MAIPAHIVAVGGLIRNSEGKALLIKSPRRGWEFPGGQVEVGEDLISALKREVKEESGISILVKQLAGVYSNIQTEIYSDSLTQKQEYMPAKVIFDFIGVAVSGELKISFESIEVGWFEQNQVLEMISKQVLKERLKVMLEFNGKVVYRAFSKEPYTIHMECEV